MTGKVIKGQFPAFSVRPDTLIAIVCEILGDWPFEHARRHMLEWQQMAELARFPLAPGQNGNYSRRSVWAFALIAELEMAGIWTSRGGGIYQDLLDRLDFAIELAGSGCGFMIAPVPGRSTIVTIDTPSLAKIIERHLIFNSGAGPA